MKRLRGIALLSALLLTVLLGGCGFVGGLFDKESSSVSEAEGPEAEEGEPDPEYPVEAGGVKLRARPGKVVSIAPALTEKLFDLGVEDRLAGVSDYCDYPASAADLPPCGTAQIPDVEVIAALSPHLVLTEAPLPEEAAAALEELEIPVAVFPHADSVDQLMDTYRGLAWLLEGETAGDLIASMLEKEFRGRLEELESSLAAHTGEEGRKKVLYLRLLNFTVATGDTFEHQLMEAACLDNIAAEHSDWTFPEETAKSPHGQAAFTGVDILFLDEDSVTIRDLEESAFYKGLPAVIKDRYLYISSIVLERQSLRTLDELVRMAGYAYPDAPLTDRHGPADGDDPEEMDEDPPDEGEE